MKEKWVSETLYKNKQSKSKEGEAEEEEEVEEAAEAEEEEEEAGAEEEERRKNLNRDLCSVLPFPARGGPGAARRLDHRKLITVCWPFAAGSPGVALSGEGGGMMAQGDRETKGKMWEGWRDKESEKEREGDSGGLRKMVYRVWVDVISGNLIL